MARHAGLGTGQLFGAQGHSHQAGTQFGGAHLGQGTPATTDFQHTVGRLECEFLQHARFELGRQHAFIFAGICRERNFHIEKCQAAVLRQHEIFAAQFEQQVKDLLVQHIPWPDLKKLARKMHTLIFLMVGFALSLPALKIMMIQ